MKQQIYARSNPIMIDLGDYYSGGYFLIRANKPDWEQLQTELLPDKLISLSRCICPRLEVSWGWIPGDRDAALQFGIPKTTIDEFLQWCGKDSYTDMDFLSMFYSPDAARRCIERFQIDANDLYLIGVGLPKTLLTANWHEPPPPQKPEYGVHIEVNLLLRTHQSPDEATELYGIEKQVEQRLPLAEGGTPLGFEVVSFAYSDFGHSWYCNHTAGGLVIMFDIHPGAHGLILRREDVQWVYDWIAEDNQQGHRAEPEPYDYWLLVSYPLDFG